MKLELIIFGITGFLLYNAYHDGKYSKFFMSYKKYIQMATIGLVGISLYLMIKRNPLQSKNLLLCANNMVKYMPIDKSSMDMISPIFDFTNKQRGFMENVNDHDIISKDLSNDFQKLQKKLINVREEIKNKIELLRNKINEDNKDSTERFLVAKKLSKKIYLEYNDLPKSILMQKWNLI